MTRMLGLMATKWVTFVPFRKAKNSARRQARAIESRELDRELQGVFLRNLREPNDFDAERAEDCYQSHPWTPGEGRCLECNTDRIDAFVYFVRCNPEREPITHTSETPTFSRGGAAAGTSQSIPLVVIHTWECLIGRDGECLRTGPEHDPWKSPSRQSQGRFWRCRVLKEYEEGL